MPAEDFRLVLIKWVDSYGCSSEWADIEGCSPVPMIYRSVGWLIHDNEKRKVVVPHLNQRVHPNVELQGCGIENGKSGSVLEKLGIQPYLMQMEVNSRYLH